MEEIFKQLYFLSYEFFAVLTKKEFFVGNVRGL